MVLARAGQRLRQAGLWLALLALFIQAALPLFLAIEIRALAAAATDTEIASSLCLHDGAGSPAVPGSHRDCTPASCPICTALAAASALAIAAAEMPIMPVSAMAAPVFAAAPVPFGAFPTLSYRSRAPPSV
jgi:hypothetical protein